VSTPALRASGVGKRYGQVWALRGCSASIPQGRISALVGPNGAGKTSLLKILAGLSAPDEGEVAVLGRVPDQNDAFLASIGYLAQSVPLYDHLTADEHVALGRHLNRNWDGAGARTRMASRGVPLGRPVRTLSGGQRAQVGLSLALAKRPEMLLLDEPVAALDPLARREFLTSLAEAVADGGLSVLVSSHLLHDLERVCDHLVLLTLGKTQLCGEIDDIRADHRMLIGPRRSPHKAPPGAEVVQTTQTTHQTRLLVRLRRAVLDPGWEVSEVALEDVILAYMQADRPDPVVTAS